MENKHVLVSIGRESGSGGRKIALAIAERLGIPCYDDEILAKAAEHSGLSEELIEKHDEMPHKSFLYSLVMGTQHAIHSASVELPLEQRIFLAEHNTIKKLAEEGSAVFVGRCSDYALESFPNLITIFISVDTADGVAHIEETYGFTLAKAKEYVKNTNKSRKEYYNYYTNRQWGDSKNYDICINRSRLGFEGTIDFLTEFIRKRSEDPAFDRK